MILLTFQILADFAISTILNGIKKQLTLTCMYNFFVDMFHSAAHIMLYIYNSKLFLFIHMHTICLKMQSECIILRGIVREILTQN